MSFEVAFLSKAVYSLVKMANKLKRAEALAYIKEHGAVLTFPAANRSDPASLWQCFHPRKKMRWEWDAGGDMAVSDLWIFREELMRSGRVAYAKWFQGKATFIDLGLLPFLLASLGVREDPDLQRSSLSPTARDIYELLCERSPLSTKDLKKETGLKGRDFEAEYTRALKELWDRLWIVGWGEKDDGAFPSLNIAATKHFFEREWRESFALDASLAAEEVQRSLSASPSLSRFYRGLLRRRALPLASKS